MQLQPCGINSLKDQVDGVKAAKIVNRRGVPVLSQGVQFAHNYIRSGT